MPTLVLIEGSGPDGWYVAKKIVNDSYHNEGHYYQFYNLDGKWAGSGACFREKSQADVVLKALRDEKPIPSGAYCIAGEYDNQWISIESITERTFVGSVYSSDDYGGCKYLYDAEESRYYSLTEMLEETDACEGDIVEVIIKRCV